VRLYLEYLDGSVQCPEGDTIIGRNVDCSLRFNDPFVSRRHLRIHFDGRSAFVDELASRNGTTLNGQPLDGRQPLKHGDQIRLGHRILSVVLVEGEPDAGAAEPTRPDFPELSAGLLEIELAMRELEASPSTIPAPPPERTCPKCMKKVPMIDGRCEVCGNLSFLGPSTTTTQKIDLGAIDLDPERRGAERHPLSIPVVYTSEALTIDATTENLSRNGVFIASALLDEVGTPAQVTLLPEAAPAIPIQCRVARVVTEGESGMGIRFEEPSERAKRWLEAVIDRRGG